MNILEVLKELGGYWRYGGGQYLAKLTSGKVSDVYCNCSVLTCRPKYLRQAAEWLIHHELPGRDPIDNLAVNLTGNENVYVCGPACGGVTLAYEVARQLGATAIFTEPVYEQVLDEGGTTDVPDDYSIVKTGQALRRFEIPEGATVLFVEDVITTGKSTREMVDAVGAAVEDICEEVVFLPYVLCLVNRSGMTSIDIPYGIDEPGSDSRCITTPGLFSRKIISLANVQARTWGSVDEAQAEFGPPFEHLEAVRPKDHWDLLTKGQ